MLGDSYGIHLEDLKVRKAGADAPAPLVLR